MPGPRLENKVCIITGGGSGFGKGIVEKFISEGAKCLIWDIHPTSAGDLSAALPKGTSIPFVGDVSKVEDWERALEAVLNEWGVLDVVVNNAGVVHKRGPSFEVRSLDPSPSTK
jgi:3-oxoacyl-[acyl-carrier protein] reductase